MMELKYKHTRLNIGSPDWLTIPDAEERPRCVCHAGRCSVMRGLKKEQTDSPKYSQHQGQSNECYLQGRDFQETETMNNLDSRKNESVVVSCVPRQ